jgi:signal recognition particle GTPase
VTVQDVNALIRQFEQMQKMMKQMMGNKRGALRAMKKMGGMGNFQ